MNKSNMGLKNFLKQQGFIEESPEEKKAVDKTAAPAPAPSVTPVYFPVDPVTQTVPRKESSVDPSFVTPLHQALSSAADQPDPSFVKFFEDELVKANLPGPDYFEFRQLLAKTQQKMAAKGVVAPDVILQAVMTSFEAQDVTPAKLTEAARHYKEILQQKNDDFLRGAAAEKSNQLQKRQSALRAHDENIKKLEQQLQQLEQQRKQLEEAVSKEKMQQNADKSLGSEGIDKIERAEKLIAQAHAFMQSSIETDIKRLQSV